jgi:hypothetical protein
LNASDVKLSPLVQFVTKMSLNPRMKRQIRSLKLSDQKTSNNNGVLFSSISLNQLRHLQALTLSDVNLDMDSQIYPMLPSLTDLRYFSMEDSSLLGAEFFTSASKSTIQILSMSTLPRKLPSIDPFQALVDVTISYCSSETLCDLFEYSPALRYLNVQSLQENTGNQSQSLRKNAVHLKQLTIQDLESEFNDLERLLKRTPNLKVLIIAKSHNLDIVDARRWRILIETSLPLLTIFKFKFYCRLENDDNNIINEFKQFHTDFWRRQHNWYVEYVISNIRAVIYTVPYISNEYEIMPHSKRYYHESTNSMNTFVNVRDLTIYLQNIPDNYEYHFSNVKSLQLEVTEYGKDQDRPCLNIKHIECLKMLINMDNLIQLKIPLGCQWKSPSVILQLLKEAFNLSSLEVHINTLLTMLNNDEACKYLSERIKKLNVAGRLHCNTLTTDEIVKVCQIFSKLEVFHCDVGAPDNLDTILHELSKLAHLKIFSYQTENWNSGHYWTGDRKTGMDSYSFTIECEYRGFDFDDISYNDHDNDLERNFDCWWTLKQFYNDFFK